MGGSPFRWNTIIADAFFKSQVVIQPNFIVFHAFIFAREFAAYRVHFFTLFLVFPPL
jgi:hypothetical protein